MIGKYTIAFDPVLPVLWLGIFAAISLGLFIFSLHGNGLKATARLIFAALLLLIMANPQLVKENRKPLNDIALVGVDKSMSGDFGQRKEKSNQIASYIQTELKKLSGLEVRLIDVAVNASDETRIFDTAEAALSDVPASQRGGTIIITDGQISDAPSGDFLKSAPLNVILNGSRKDIDREIKIINSPGYSVVGEPVLLKFKIEDHNIKSSQTATVTLNLPDGSTQSREILIGTEETWLLDTNTAGQNVFELSTPNLDGELSTLNNRAVINVQGVRNRLHVLLVSGEPYPGARMWRDLLKADPGVDLVHFTILRSPEKVDMTPTDELSLIPFPVEELFGRKLKDFDLIIMDRFSLNRALPDYYFQNMRDYVENGGALMEISGPSYGQLNSLYNTSLGAILPGAPNGEILSQSFKPKITDLGRSHPVTMPLTQIPTWGSWLQQIPVTPLSGDILMTGIDNNPLLTLSHVNKGRIAQMTSDQIWLWARGFEGGGPTTELLRRTVHWLMKEPELDENALFAETNEDAINLRLRSTDVIPEMKATLPDGTIENIELTKGEDGWLTGGIKNAKQGVYKFSDGIRQKIISVGDTTTPEFSNIITTDKILLPFSKKSGGSVIWAEDDKNFNVARLIKRNRDSSVISSEMKTLLPPELSAFLVILAGLSLWHLESRARRAGKH